MTQTNAPSSGSAEVLAGLGFGWRENRWTSLDLSSLRALVFMAAGYSMIGGSR